MGCPRTSVASGAASAVSGASNSRHQSLRAGLAALALILMAPAGAVAADMPEFLRGSYSPSSTRWDGFYVGGQAGKTFGSADFGNATQPMVSYILANTELQSIVSDWTTLRKGSTGGPSFGGFIGYNFQWDDVVMGFELNYNRMSLDTGARDTVGPILVPGAPQNDLSTVQYSVTETSNATVAIQDIATVRARAGWAYDRLLPYGFVGVAVGRADVSRFVNVDVTKAITPPPIIDAFGVSHPQPQGPFLSVALPRNPQSQSQGGVIAYGFTAGLGVEVALMQNLFVRAEWEFIEFPNIADFRVSVNSARVGVGLKF
jgi:outer membrane immunogenic protein